MTQQNNTPNETPINTQNETPINMVDDENNINNFLRNITNSIYNNTFFNVDETLNNQNTILHPSTSPQPLRTPPPPLHLVHHHHFLHVELMFYNNI